MQVEPLSDDSLSAWKQEDFLDEADVDADGEHWLRMAVRVLATIKAKPDVDGVETILENAFWVINDGCAWWARSSIESRRAAIEAIPRLFDVELLVQRAGEMLNMSWDIILGRRSWHERTHPPEDSTTAFLLLATIEAMLQEQSEAGQMAALHGLAHLCPPNLAQILDRNEHMFVSNQVIAYARQVALHQVL